MSQHPGSESDPQAQVDDQVDEVLQRRFNIGPGGSLDLDNVFSYHAPFGDQTKRYEEIRSYGHDFAVVIEADCPPSPERTTALGKVREAVMWANAAIACHEKRPTSEEEAEADRVYIARMREMIERPR